MVTWSQRPRYGPHLQGVTEARPWHLETQGVLHLLDTGGKASAFSGT